MNRSKAADKAEFKEAAARARRREILKEGQKVFATETFRKGLTQTHHRGTTVANHTLEVTDWALRIADALERKGISIDREEVLISALCHDLGIIGRDEKFSNTLQCWLQHPKDSVALAEELYPGLSSHTKRVIGRHMWPATPMFPTSREGWILDLADTIASMNDFFRPNHEHTLSDVPNAAVFAEEDGGQSRGNIA